MTTQKLTPEVDQIGKRADLVISEWLSISRSAASILCQEGNVIFSNHPVSKNDKIKQGEYMITLPDPKPLDTQPENIPLDIVYEDAHLLVVNKPRGMVVHPAAGNENGTLVNALLYHCGDSLSGINGVLRPGIVHRID